MAYGDRKSERIAFDRGLNARILAVDGSWARDCVLADISQTGARLTVKGAVEGLDLREFFLMLSTTGRVYRRCQLVRSSGAEIGLRFIDPQGRKAAIASE